MPRSYSVTSSSFAARLLYKAQRKGNNISSSEIEKYHFKLQKVMFFATDQNFKTTITPPKFRKDAENFKNETIFSWQCRFSSNICYNKYSSGVYNRGFLCRANILNF